jgi:PKD repeat protein
VNFADLSTVLAPSVINQWNWDFGDGNTSTQQTPTHCYTGAGAYTVILTVSTGNGCTNTITFANYINVYAVPVAAFTVSPQPTTILNSTLYFTDASSNASAW